MKVFAMYIPNVILVAYLLQRVLLGFYSHLIQKDIGNPVRPLIPERFKTERNAFSYLKVTEKGTPDLISLLLYYFSNKIERCCFLTYTSIGLFVNSECLKHYSRTNAYYYTQERIQTYDI